MNLSTKSTVSFSANATPTDMRLVLNDSRDPAFSLAAEEYLLTEKNDGEWLMLWRSEPSVIIGKFQNSYAEVSLTECERCAVNVFRRNSGGGCVYHDTGNLNYTIIADRGDESPEYERFLSPIVDFLASLRINAEIRDKSALFVGDKKISGNAESVVGGRVMHHGTLLFDADLSTLGRITGHAREKIKSKSIPSNPSPVANIRPMLDDDMTIECFADSVANALCDGEYRFTADEVAMINAIADEKYRTWEWNYGRSPALTLETNGLTLFARHGMIEGITMDGAADIASLVGCRLTPFDVRQRLSDRAYAEEIVKLIFD